MAVLAISRSQNVIRFLAARHNVIVAAGARLSHSAVIEARRAPADCCMAGFALIPRGYVVGVFSWRAISGEGRRGGEGSGFGLAPDN